MEGHKPVEEPAAGLGNRRYKPADLSTWRQYFLCRYGEVMDEQSAKAHKEICEQWRRYQDLTKAVYSLQSTLGELIKDMNKTGQEIYQLYKASDNGLNGSPPESA